MVTVPVDMKWCNAPAHFAAAMNAFHSYFAILPKSNAQFAVRTETDELNYFSIGLWVNQHQVGFDVAVSMVLPITCQQMIAVLISQWLVVRQCRHKRCKLAFVRCTMLTFGLALQVSFKLGRLLNRPHQVQPGVRRE